MNLEIGLPVLSAYWGLEVEALGFLVSTSVKDQDFLNLLFNFTFWAMKLLCGGSLV